MKTTNDIATELRATALACLLERDVTRKISQVNELAQAWQAQTISLDATAQLSAPLGLPGQPEKPELVFPRDVKRRGMNTLEGRAILIHALAHIEFNAINLALDAVWRFNHLPSEFYADWLKVAQEEALHFSLLADHLALSGYHYGDFPAHNSLWEMAERTEQDVLARMALVPRTMEARGLDVTPSIRDKLAQAGDHAAAQILDIILRDEIGHVTIGNRWYEYLCAQRHLEPISTYARLVKEYDAPTMRKPLNLEARKIAGFSDVELASFCQ